MIPTVTAMVVSNEEEEKTTKKFPMIHVTESQRLFVHPKPANESEAKLNKIKTRLFV